MTIGAGHRSCTLPGCKRPNQQSAGDGYSRRYCKHHVEFHRRHGSYWFRSFTAKEMAPVMSTARKWLKANANDPRIKSSLSAIDELLQGSGRHLSAYHLRGKSAQERARIALTRLRRQGVEPATILLRAIAVTAHCEARGIDDRQREFRHVQIAKSVHRLASGTRTTTSGFPLPVKYPRSEGQVLRHIGVWIEDIVSFALDGRDISQTHVDE